jgi:antirestriction protein ArdC
MDARVRGEVLFGAGYGLGERLPPALSGRSIPLQTHLDIHQTITENIVAAIEADAGHFKLPWQRSGMATFIPKNAVSGNAYAGINVVALWAEAMVRRNVGPIVQAARRHFRIGSD